MLSRIAGLINALSHVIQEFVALVVLVQIPFIDILGEELFPTLLSVMLLYEWVLLTNLARNKLLARVT